MSVEEAVLIPHCSGEIEAPPHRSPHPMPGPRPVPGLRLQGPRATEESQVEPSQAPAVASGRPPAPLRDQPGRLARPLRETSPSHLPVGSEPAWPQAVSDLGQLAPAPLPWGRVGEAVGARRRGCLWLRTASSLLCGRRAPAWDVAVFSPLCHTHGRRSWVSTRWTRPVRLMPF